MGNSKKVMLIGWDAADWKVIHKLMDRGYLPTIKYMVENGVMGNMRTLLPAFSPMLWTSIATGKRPFKHGIYGFYEPTADRKSVQPMTNVSRKCKAIWNILNQHEKESLVVGWWPSHPAEPINGVMVSDYFHKAPKRPGDAWKLMPKSVHPPESMPEVAEFRVHPMEMQPEHVTPFVPFAHEVDQTIDGRLSVIMRMLAECTTVHATTTHLLENKPWDFCAVYHDAIDHFSHSFMKYHPPQQEYISDHDFRLYQQVVDAIYIYHDMMLNRMLQLADEDTTVIVMSDHGFHPDHLRPKTIATEPAGPAAEHRDFGILMAMGPGIRKDHVIHGANLLDITPTILTIFGLPIGEDMDGQVLSEIFEQPPAIEWIESWEDVDGEDGQHPEGMELDAADTQAALDQLVALGYIDPPDENADTEVAKSQRELDYNLARSYMDADMHGEAIPLLNRLYCENPLEFRFGIQLCNCLNAMGRISELEQVIEHLNSSWRVAATEAKKKIREIAKISRERRAHWRELKKIDDENDDPDQPRLAQVNAEGKPKLFEEHERNAIRKLRGVARGNPQTLDFLAAVAAVSKNDFEGALEHLERAELTQSKNPGFQFHVGNVYLGLNRLDDAERAFTKAMELDEYHANGLMGLCRTYLEKDQVDKALQLGRQAVGLKFHFPLGHYFYGCARQRSGDIEGAIQSLQTAIEQNPNFAEAHERLAKIYSKSETDLDLAKEHRTVASDLSADNREVSQEQSSIELPTINAEEFRNELPKVFEANDEHFLRCLGQAKRIDQLAVAQQEAIPEKMPDVIVVSGLPRSGTSMMMQMLVAAGLTPFTDDKRNADESNPKGYYEADLVKQLATHNSWVEQCDGKVVKVVAPLIHYLPQAANYKVIFMERDISEVLSSQESMLQRLDQDGGNIQQERLAMVYASQVRQAKSALRVHGHQVLPLQYVDVLSDPEQAAAGLAEFLGVELELKQAVSVVDPNLYRERAGS